MDVLALKYLKTYQIWHHRRLLVQQTKDPGAELEFVAKALRTDTKNYHTWSYLLIRKSHPFGTRPNVFPIHPEPTLRNRARLVDSHLNWPYL
ncbi:hypothetical protein BU15DRAFT_53989 [Melanogaster broomeanus]|nr:hypothetical protein BU15DRAFT_53989 [Melanogaster broomeanus]